MEVTLFAEKIFQVGALPITNTLLTTWLTMAVVLTLAYVSVRKVTLVPNFAQSAAETVVETIYNLAVGLGDEGRAKRFFNSLTLVPVVSKTIKGFVFCKF